MVLLIQHPAGHAAERTYILDVLLREFLGLEYVSQTHSSADVRITLLGAGAQPSLSMPDILFACPEADWLRSASLPQRPLAVWEPSDPLFREADVPSSLPVIYGRARNGEWFSLSHREAYLGLDIFGSAFFMLTRYEEAVTPDRDSHDRFPASAALAFQEGFLTRPIVNEYLEVLWALLRHLWPGLRRRPRSYRFLLSHDVDALSVSENGVKVARSLGADLFRRREPMLALRRMRAWCVNRFSRTVADFDPFNTFDFIMTTSESAGVRSSFYFQASLSSQEIDARYQIGAPWTRRLLRRIHRRGHEIGFHPSYLTHEDATATRNEFDRFLKVCSEEEVRQDQWGGRQHYLRWTNPDTWQNWEQCGLAYDSTLSYAQQVGFRCGCCYEYPVMNLHTRQRLKLRERPLVVMEDTLLAYMGCSLEVAEQKVNDLIATCRRYQGDFTFLWHNQTLATRSAKQTYARIVRTAAGSHVGA
jgi:hypothetical protein